ncbi:MAG: CYTH domain-containing protein [Magnetococcus sp. MYC-9]
MATEIERRYLVSQEPWLRLGRPLVRHACTVRQGFLSTDKERVVRVRVVEDRAMLTIKGLTRGFTKQEFEYAIPLADARQMLDELCLQPLIEKRRYQIEQGGLLWEVDEFFGVNQGLLLAEVELTDAGQKVPLPPWVGREISADPRYFNSSLSINPYSNWRDSTD